MAVAFRPASVQVASRPSAPPTPQLDLMAPDEIIADGSSAALLARSAAVVTVNSSVGLEAFAYDRPVVTLDRASTADAGSHTKCKIEPLAAAFKGLGDLSFDADALSGF